MASKTPTWLEALKAGDTVLMHNRPATVDRITATQVIIGRSRFSRRDGYEIGGGRGSLWMRSRLREATPESLRAAHLAKLKAWAGYDSGPDIKHLSVERIEQVYDLVKRLRAEQDAEQAEQPKQEPTHG